MVVRLIGLQTFGALAAQAQVPGFFVEPPMQPSKGSPIPPHAYQKPPSND